MVVGEASIHNIMGGMESTGGVRLHNHKRKLKQRFDIIKKLGQGTYGKVQLGINKETGQEVAIKTIKKCKIETEADLIRIRREIQIMSSVQHPNIIHIYEVFENREKMVLVMEYAAGGELYDYLSERKVLSEQEARRIFRQIATAVFYCHKHKICHRDLKLENILLDQIGNAKIADFGLSNVFDEQRLLSTFCGSPLYASPEIVKGTPYHGPEVDCWSLGVLLYTLVYGAMPFDGSNFKRLVKQISQSDYFEPKKPSPASPLIRDMLTACPARRADIEKICSHWWVNEGYEQNCLDIAEDLAAQTPVRLDLLLSLVPQSASAEKLLVGDQQTSGDVANNMSSETLVPTRCHSVGSLMEFDQNNSDRRIRELFEDENRAAAGVGAGAGTGAVTDAKRKLETTPSMDETNAATVKKKERSRRKERSDEREPRMYRSTSRHHSAPIPNSIMEETMEVEPTATATVPTSKTVDLNKLNEAACLELIEESKEKSPSKERSKTPVPIEHEQLPKEMSAKNIDRYCDTSQNENKESMLQDKYLKKSEEKSNLQQAIASVETNKSTHALPNKVSSSKKLINDTSKINVPNKDNLSNSKLEIDDSHQSVSDDTKQIKSMDREIKKLKERALSLDFELANEVVEDVLAKPAERRRSRIFETTEKFNQMSSSLENDKPKKIFIPGVNVGGAKRAFERKASLTSGTITPVKHNASKVIIDVDKKSEKIEDKSKLNQASIDTEEKLIKRDEAKKRAVDIISGAIGKPPVLRKVNGSPPTSPQNQESKKIGLKSVGPNDIRSATVSASASTENKFSFDNNSISSDITTPTTCEISENNNSLTEEPKLSSKMEITLKSATLPRPRKTSKAEITLSGHKIPDTVAFKSEVEAKVDTFPTQKLRTQKSEIAFPVAAVVPQANRSSSLEPEIKPKVQPRERIIPIQVEPDHQHAQQSSTTPPKPPMPQRSMSQRSGSLSRQSTADSDTDSALGSTIGPEPIRKSPREYIIPIAVEGGGYVTPRSGSVEPESKTGTSTGSINAPRSRFSRPRRMSSLLSDASEDESPFSTLHRDSEDLLQRHMHRLRSSRPSRQPSEHGDSLSSGEDDDDDGFELLTAENLFSTLLSRVRSLTQRLNVDDTRGSSFPSSRLLGRLGVNSPQNFWSHNKPLSRRLSESQFKHSLSRDTDIFGRKDSTSSINPGSPNSPSSHNAPSSRESVFEIGSNTLPRDKVEHEDIEAEAIQIRKEAQESLEQNFTPSLARRLSRQFIEQTRQSLPRSPSILCEKYYQSPTRENLSLIDTPNGIKRHSSSTSSDQTEYRSRSADRNIRRTNSLLEAGNKADKPDYRFSRRSISLFDDDDNFLSLPRQVMTLGRKYKESGKLNSGNTWKDTFSVHRTDKIQEESLEDTSQFPKEVLNSTDNNVDIGPTSECTSISICNSNTNLVDTTSSISNTSPVDSSSNILIDSGKSLYRMESSKNFENRLLAAENLIKESKLKNLGPTKFDPNLNSNYKETDKCDKESLSSISDAPNVNVSKRRSCIPSLRLRSGSLTREPCIDNDRRKSFAGSQSALSNIRALSPEKSILSKFFRAGSSKENDSKDKSQKPKQHRISRFLRPDFFDTPREESRYVKEKEAQKAAENERRKSRFMKKKNENKSTESKSETKPEKELKNEMNSLKKDKSDNSSDDKSNKNDNSNVKFERQSSRSSFLHSLEKKLEKFRVTDDTSKSSNGGILIDQKVRALRENSAPPSDSLFTESNLIKRAISVEDLSLTKESSLNSRKSKVSSVLGLFKSSDGKQNSNATKSQSTLMSKLKKSPPKVIKADTSTNEDTSSTSKIPMKMIKNDSRSIKKPIESKKTLDNTVTESKKLLYKDKVKERDTNLKERKLFNEKQSKTSEEDKLQVNKLSSTEISTVDKEIVKKTNSCKKEDDPKAISNTSETRKIIDNVSLEGNSSKQENKILKTKKSIGSVKKISTTALTKSEKEENGDKKGSKISKLKDPVQKEEAEGTKKKKIVRVVKKVVKKSLENSDNKSEEKVKVTKPIGKGNTSSKKEKSPEVSAFNVDNSNERNSDLLNLSKITTNDCSTQETHTKLKANLSSVDLISNKCELASGNNASKNVDNIQMNTTDSDTSQIKYTEPRLNRGNLKLDLSKIPQHTFRNTTSKKESPKSESIKVNANASSRSPKINESTVDIPSEKFLDSLSKMTHHATITGNKIIIDKPLRAKDVAELKKEVNECTRRIENQIELHNDTMQSNEDIIEVKEDEMNAKYTASNIIEETISVNEKDSLKDTMQSTNMDNTYADEITSPIDEPDSFDSWSLCSADLNHTRVDLSSPTSPSYSLFSRGDQGESVIDRIRRRSFYLRFNDRRRPSLTVPPPGVTLPRKYSFSSSRDRDRSKLNSYPSSNKKLMQRSYSLHNDDINSFRKSPIDKEKYTDLVSYNMEVKTPTDHYSSYSHSTYDPLRKYLRSPTLELSTAHKRYHSTDFSTEDELGTYRNSSLNSILNVNPVEFYGSRNSSMLPRKYGSTITSSEPKTVEYYEELLSPNNPEYLTVRKSPMSNEYLNRCENGYHNTNSVKPKTCIAKTRIESTEDINKELEERGRITNRCNSESKDLPSTSSSDF
ncbi:PREDICTED: uncharacterized protein LOC106784548 [Polistes canadensis]|uniref:uncharacterized protein LOC106784548 n=1 Tax=Polistes canadensis TaxID=91411 RepID=UPI000718D557|nr:PREDICTED: uncharacterized protein LOC106784548 [Polistes canadensis]